MKFISCRLSQIVTSSFVLLYKKDTQIINIPQYTVVSWPVLRNCLGPYIYIYITQVHGYKYGNSIKKNGLKKKIKT